MKSELDPIITRQDANQLQLFRMGVESSAIEPTRIALDYLDNSEIGDKPIPGRENLVRRLYDLSQGTRVPVVAFNCIDFTWQEAPLDYPESTLLEDTSTSICLFRINSIKEIIVTLKTIGSPDATIIIPDSEIFDERVFSYAQDLQTRIDIARSIKTSLLQQLDSLGLSQDISVQFWSEYCFLNGLPSPFEYTENNKKKIENDPQLMNRVVKQVKDSKDYFVKNGLDSFYVTYDIPDKQMLERVLWYTAMYAGEGQALLESNAIVLNFEDKRVLTWFQKGANNQLPVITPADPTEYYRWRNVQQKKTPS